MQQPKTQYARNDDVNIAYQVIAERDAGTNDEVLNGARYKHLAGASKRADSRADV